MAIGAWAPNSSTNQRIRLSMVLSYTGDPSTGSVTVHKTIKAECGYRIDDSNNTFLVTGDGGTFSGSRNLDFPSSNSVITLWSGSSVEALTYGATRAATGSASITGIEYIGSSVKATVSGSITLPARPYSVPSAVTGLSATRVSDTRADLSWTRNSTTAGFYEGIKVLRSTDGGSYVQIANLAGTATGYADTSVSANHSYRYKVVPYNSTGSAETLSGYVYNTPAAPTALTATKTAATSVTVAWANPGNTETATEVQRSTDAGATWTTIGTTGTDATSYVDAAAPGGTVIYRARNTRSALASAWSAASNSVATLTPPAAPTLTDKPALVVSSAVDTVNLGWLHNSLDGSAQTAAEVEVTRNGVVTTATLTTAAAYALDLSTLTTGQSVSVRVRTKGLHATYSPWSALYTFTVVDPPQLIITAPVDDTAVVGAVPVEIAWDYIDASYAIAAWTLELYLGDALVHQASGTTEVPYSLDEDTYLPINGSAYRIALSVRSGSTLTAAAERLFTVDYLPPATPVLEATVDVDTGAVQLAAFAGEDAEAPATSYLSISRVEDGQIVLLASNMGEGTVVIDPLPLLNRVNVYRVTAHTEMGLTSVLDAEVDVQVGPWFIWNYGDGLAKTARLKGNPQWSHDYATEQELFQMAGRTYPVLMTGRRRGETIDFAGTARTDEQRDQLDDLALWAKRAVYREPHGVRKNVKAKVSSSEGGGPRKTEYQIKMEVVD